MAAGETFAICISRVRNRAIRRALIAIRPDIEAAAADYVVKADNAELYRIPQVDPIGTVPGTEMVRTYDGRMAQKGQPGRPIYDRLKLLPDNDRCPFCDLRNVSTLDHFLPKQDYPIFAVTPVNLVGCCADCNKLKHAAIPMNANNTVLHPYFDDVTTQKWLAAVAVERAPAAVTFHVVEVDEWDVTLNARVVYQFELLRLAELYSRQAAHEIANIRANLCRHFEEGGAAAVRSELQWQWESRRRHQLNSWQTATYEALAKSDWFCGGGFTE